MEQTSNIDRIVELHRQLKEQALLKAFDNADRLEKNLVNQLRECRKTEAKILENLKKFNKAKKTFMATIDCETFILSTEHLVYL